jgi:hypothetical protein
MRALYLILIEKDRLQCERVFVAVVGDPEQQIIESPIRDAVALQVQCLNSFSMINKLRCTSSIQVYRLSWRGLHP